jgi:hypothetical protein
MTHHLGVEAYAVEVSRKRLAAKVGKSNLTYNDLTYLLASAQSTIKVLRTVARMNKHPENWSRVELARGTPSWKRVEAEKKEADRIKALATAIAHVKRTLANA